jgi:hypothetical protein
VIWFFCLSMSRLDYAHRQLDATRKSVPDLVAENEALILTSEYERFSAAVTSQNAPNKRMASLGITVSKPKFM